jgi:peptidoglycan/xylan/chitin deacetylase (PgdA/CDA1 family)
MVRGRVLGMSGALALALGLGLATLQPVHVAADEADQSAAGPPPWVRSVACPVLYAHEVRSQTVMRRFLVDLLRLGYQPVPLASIDSALAGTIDLPKGCVVLTFDDGLLSQYLNALPVLDDMQVPAAFFVLPGFNDGVHRYMGPAELQGLASFGFEVELHTCNHPNLPLLARRDLDAFYAELQDCRRMLQDTVGQAVDYVAYPSGAYDATVLDAVARFGFRGGFTTAASATLNYRSPYTLPRIRYDPSESASVVVRRIKAAGG